MFLKRWFSFKRDWRMWLILFLPAMIISFFLMIGFQREYKTSAGINFEYTNMLAGVHGKNSSELNQTEISTAISAIGGLSQNDLMNMNSSAAGNYLKNIMENPSMENIIKNVMDL